MINFVVINSNKNHRKNICSIIINNMMSNKIDFKINEFSDFKETLKNYIDDRKSNLIYVISLELSTSNGLDISRYIRNTINDWNCPIILISEEKSSYYDILNQKLQILDYIPKYGFLDKSLNEDIEISLRILNNIKSYKYTYKNIDYNINIDSINFIQRDGRRTKIVAGNNVYHQNISINEIKKKLPTYFIISGKGTLLNTRNVIKINWKDPIVFFKDGTKDYVATISHKKEIEKYKINNQC